MRTPNENRSNIQEASEILTTPRRVEYQKKNRNTNSETAPEATPTPRRVVTSTYKTSDRT